MYVIYVHIHTHTTHTHQCRVSTVLCSIAYQFLQDAYGSIPVVAVICSSTAAVSLASAELCVLYRKGARLVFRHEMSALSLVVLRSGFILPVFWPNIFFVFGRKKKHSRGWFRSIDLWVMGPARSHCATLLACWWCFATSYLSG